MNKDIVNRSRRHHAAETSAQVVYLPGQTIGHFAVRAATFLLATVVRGLLYPDAARTEGPVEGYSQYILRLAGTSYTAWSSADVSYVTGNLRTQDNLLYTCLQDHTSSSGTQPGTTGGAAYWELSTEITALPSGQEAVLGTASGTYYDTPPNMRDFSPWFQVGAVVRLELRNGFYFFVDTLTRVKGIDSTTQSIMWNDVQHRQMGVYA